MFVREGKFCKEAQEAALYLKFKQELKWVDVIISDGPLSMERLRTVVEMGLNVSFVDPIIFPSVFPTISFRSRKTKSVFYG